MKKKWIPKKEIVVSFRIPDEMNDKLESKSFQMKISTSDIIRKALENFLPEGETENGQVGPDGQDGHRQKFRTLEFLRRRRGITQEELGKALGVSRQLISAWENETANIDPKHLDKLKDILQIDESIVCGLFSSNPPPITEEDENFITADLAKRIYDKAFERAKIRRGLLLERIKEQIRKEYRDFTDEQCLEIIRAIPNETISRIFIMAEISRMNSSISFLAGKSEEGADA